MIVKTLLFLSLILLAQCIEVLPVTLPNGTVIDGWKKDTPVITRYPNFRFEDFYAALVFPGVPRVAQFPFTINVDGREVFVRNFLTISNSVNTTYKHDTLAIELANSGNYDGIFMLEFLPPANPAGYVNYIRVGNADCESVEIPVLAMEFFDGIRLFETMGALAEQGSFDYVVVKVSAADTNLWTDTFQSGWFRFWQMIIVPFCVLNVYLAVKKLFTTVDRDACRLNVGQVTLVSLAFANLFRAVLFYVDPLFSQQYLSYEVLTFVLTIHLPFEMITTMLLALYWVTLLDESDLGVRTFLGLWSIPLIILAVLLFGQEVLFGLIRVTSPKIDTSFAIVASAVAYAFFNVAVLIFFFYNGKKVLNLTKEMDTPFYSRLRKVTYRIMISGVFIAAWVIPLLVIAFFPFTFFNPIGNTVIWFFLMFILLLTGFIEISAITVPPKNMKSKSKTSTKTRN